MKSGYEIGTPGSAAWAFTKTADGYKPNNQMEINNDDRHKLNDLVDKLKENDDVINVFTTIDDNNSEQ